MVEIMVFVQSEVGLHARPASLFVQEAQKYQSEIYLCSQGKVANAKSILAVLGLGVTQGTQVTIQAAGADERDAVASLNQLVLNNFGETL